MTTILVEIETPGGTFGTFTEAAEAGYPVGCQMFARCGHVAVAAVKHPILKAVPACEHCAAWYEGTKAPKRRPGSSGGAMRRPR